MSFDWNQYYILAQALSGNTSAEPSEEAKKRSAVSRAYYAALIQARDKVSERLDEPYPTDGNTHYWTINKYKSADSPNMKGIGPKIERLKKRRERVDYDDRVVNLDSELRSAMQEASQILHQVEGLPD